MFSIYDFIKDPTLEKIKYIVNDFYRRGVVLHNYTFLGLSLLHVKQGPETMKYLLNKGLNPNNSGIYNLKPIHLQKEYETIKLLIDAGAQPNPKCRNNMNPLFWQKDPDAMELLLNTNDIYFSRIFSRNKFKAFCPYTQMLVAGGYDYSEEYVSVSPVFLQRDPDTMKVLLDHCYNNYLMDFNFDLNFENILFKSCVNDKIIRLFSKYKYGDIYDVNHQNIVGNTALHVQYIPENILALLETGADYKLRNTDGLDAFEYHVIRNNLNTANIIRNYSAAKTIQNAWRNYWFRKTYIPPKYFKIKKEFLDDFTLLPPSECKTFPGGIEYQNAFEDFNRLINVF